MPHPYDAITEADLRAAGGKKWAEFPAATGAWIAETDFPAAPPVAAALRAAFESGLAYGYLPSGLAAGLCEAAADFQRRHHGWDLTAADVRLSADVLTALSATIRIFTTPGSPVILPTPAYMPFFTLPGAQGREILTVPMLRDETGRYSYDLDALAAAFAAGGELLILCNPHNPIGRVLERAELEAIAAVVAAAGGRVFADEIHAPLVFSGHRHVPYAMVSPAAAAHTVTATSTSKAFNTPGLKAAQVFLTSEADKETWEREGGEWTADQVATPGVIAATAAWTHGDAWLADEVAYLERNVTDLEALVAQHLPGVGYRRPEGTYLTWLDFTGTGIADPATYFRERAGVAATDGANCGAPGFLRLNAATPNPILRDVVARLGAALRDAT